MTTETNKLAVKPPTTGDAEGEEEERRRQIELNQPAIALLQSWLEGDEEDEQEQRETLAILKQGLDENRLPGQKLFSAS